MAATDIITYSQPSTGWGLFRCTRRTAAHLDFTKKELARRFPGAELQIIQGCYNDNNPASEGTHDFDACLDVRIIGLSWMEAQTFLRACGWAAWWRQPWQGPWNDHIHMISLGFAEYGIKVGKYVDGGRSLFGVPVTSSQVEDYFNHAYGLEGMHTPGGDRSWFPPDIIATIFDFEAWERELEDNVPWNDWPAADKNAMLDAIEARMAKVQKTLPAKVWNFVIRTSDKSTARKGLRIAAFGEEEEK